jgi:fumarate hydratase subunit beta
VNECHLTTPLGDEVLWLRAGDRVTLSGVVYTARDEAHLRMQKEGIPFEPYGAAIYHCGPIIVNRKVIAAGPTTSSRMDELTGFLIRSGVRALIGKGGMSRQVAEALKGRGVYLAFTGGCAALAADRMRVCDVRFEELGMAEAVWKLALDKLPLVVGIDSHGRDLFDEVKHAATRHFRERYRRREP